MDGPADSHSEIAMRRLQHIHLGQADYAGSLALQQRLVDDVLQDRSRAHLVTVEHCPPVITLGRRGDMTDILASPAQLADAGIEVHACSRGGQATYHGPGQLVAYPVWQLARGGRSVHGHVRLLERAVIRLLGRFGIAAERRADAIGVYVGQAKIAAIGVAVRRWVCYHGLALNVQPDLSHFDLIVPCGQPGAAATSMAKLLGGELNMIDVVEQLVACVREVCGFDECSAAEVDAPVAASVESNV